MNEKRSFRIHGQSTTINLELPFWHKLEEAAVTYDIELSSLITRLHDDYKSLNGTNFTSHLRVFCLLGTTSMNHAAAEPAHLITLHLKLSLT